MKQKDIALIVVIVIVTAFFSYFISNALFASAEMQQMEAEVVERISPDFPEPDQRYFNDDAIDPTQLIEIGDSSNPQPFSERN